jgi:hypothetical protein
MSNTSVIYEWFDELNRFKKKEERSMNFVATTIISNAL